MLQARGFARRHGWAIVDAEGHNDVPADAETSFSRSADLSSPGTIDRKPPSAGAPQAPGASAIADKALALKKPRKALRSAAALGLRRNTVSRATVCQLMKQSAPMPV